MQKKKQRRSNIKDIIFVTIILLTCFFVFCLVKGNVPAIFGYRMLYVVSGSMEPAIGVGDVVLVCEMDSDNLDIGDIIQYSKKSYTVIHRIVDKNVEENGITWFTTKGDYNNAPDAEKVLPEQIEGRVVLIIPEIGRLILRIHGV